MNESEETRRAHFEEYCGTSPELPQIWPARSFQAPSYKLQAHWNHTSPNPSALTLAGFQYIDILYPRSLILNQHHLSLGELRLATSSQGFAPLRTTNRLTPAHGLLRKGLSKLQSIHKIRSRCLTAGCSLLATTVDAIAMDPTGADVRARRVVVEAVVVEAAESTAT